MVFTVIVSLYAKDGVEDQLRAKLAEAAHHNAKDPSVLGWHPMQSASDPRKWTIVERYDQESVRICCCFLPTIPCTRSAVFSARVGGLTQRKRRDNADMKAFAETLFVLLESGKDSLEPHMFNEL
ncbi:ABM domain-containing protein [Phytophthora infestans]|uniref:ABM domain-containing protein n=1 Tax=Phytophthora infestans TaxID=4787 RepID=A0A833RZT9_PHYIN|nr:ABM domain-containing protein [Phytophthora infestans]